jgi:hypothetical protein
MNEESQISQLIARKIAGVTSENEIYEWKKITCNDPEMELALEVIINLWNAPGIRNKKEVEAAFRKVSFRLNEKRITVMNVNQQQRRRGLWKWMRM